MKAIRLLAVAAVATTTTLFSWTTATKADATPPNTPQTQVGARAVHYGDSFSGVSRHLSDQQLGFATHWEGSVDLSSSTSPIQWTRVQDTANTATSATGTAPTTFNAAKPGQIRAATRSRDLTRSTCDNPGGVKMWHNSAENGECIRFTGVGDLSLPGVQFPYGSDYVNYSQAFSTVGSNGAGHMQCNKTGSDFQFFSGTDYTPLLQRSGYHCDGYNGGDLHIYITQ